MVEKIDMDKLLNEIENLAVAFAAANIGEDHHGPDMLWIQIHGMVTIGGDTYNVEDKFVLALWKTAAAVCTLAPYELRLRFEYHDSQVVVEVERFGKSRLYIPFGPKGLLFKPEDIRDAILQHCYPDSRFERLLDWGWRWWTGIK